MSDFDNATQGDTSGFSALLPRTSPPFVADEARMLLAWLVYHRGTLAMKCEGLSEQQLKQRPISTSTMTLLGLVRHVTDVERYWMRQIVLGHANIETYYSDESPDGDFDDLHDTSVADVVATWIAEGRHTVTVVDQAETLDGLCAGSLPSRPTSAELAWEGEGGSVLPEIPTLRWVLTHLVEEFARHNGHADILRELIDDSTGE